MLQAVRHFVHDEVATARNLDILTDICNGLQVQWNSVKGTKYYVLFEMSVVVTEELNVLVKYHGLCDAISEVSDKPMSL